MKTLEIKGVVVEDAPSLWHDLLKQDFDVESVGVSQDATFVYLADDEEKDPRPVAAQWVGKKATRLNFAQHEDRKASIMQLLENAKKGRAERAAVRAAALAAEEERHRKAVLETQNVTDGDIFPREMAIPVEAAAAAVPGVPVAKAPAQAVPKESVFKKIFRVFRT